MRMKKKNLLIVFIFCSLFCYSESSDFSFFLEPLFGVKVGQVDEYVFLNEPNFEDDRYSELNWDLKPELYAGFKLNGQYKKIFLETSFLFGFPGKTGMMKDSDWLNNGVSYFPEESLKNYKTCYSEHDNYLVHDFSFDIKTGYLFCIADFYNFNLELTPFVSFKYENFKFDGKDGTGWYGDKSGVEGNQYYYEFTSALPKDFNGKIISYNRINYIFWTGLDVKFELFEKFGISAAFKFSPYVFSKSKDNHLTNGTDYLDVTPGFFGMFDWNFGIFYNINKRNSVCLNANYFYMRILRGNDYIDSNGTEKFENPSSVVEGGAGANYLNISLSYKFKIF